MKIKTHDGVELFVKDWGSGPPLLFVAAAGVSNELWQYQHAHFAARGHRVVAFDRRGHGRSDQPFAGYDADSLADDIAAVIGARELDGVTLVAHSAGSVEAVRYLARHGHARVRRLVLVGTTTPFLRTTADNPDAIDGALCDALREGWTRDYPRWVSDTSRAFFVPETSRAMISWGEHLLYETPVHVALAVNRMCTDTDFRADCERVEVPTLLIHGDRDVSCPLALTAKRTERRIRGAELLVYPGAPHGLMLTHMAQLHADLERFVAP